MAARSPFARILLILLMTAMSESSWAGAEFYFFTDQGLVDSISQHLPRVDQQVGPAFRTNQVLDIGFDPDRNVEFDFRKKAIFVGSLNLPSLTHEYGHFLLDQYLLRHSLDWRYVWLRLKHFKVDLATISTQLKQKQADIEDALADFGKEPEKNRDILIRARRTLDQTLADLAELSVVTPMDEEIAPHFGSGNHFFSAIAPYHELFSDFLGALVMGSWSIMEETSRKLRIEKGDRLQVPEGGTEEEIFKNRTFHKNLKFDNYSFQEWQSENDYTQFPIVRSYLRSLIEERQIPHSLVLEVLAGAIGDEFREIAQGRMDVEIIGLKEKNQSLIDRIERRLGQSAKD
ncbi:MAG: hypothetical protein H6624_08465 [Bdellovibrionaceae bacterium]|nr:hypothetical protein [Bdellovibrionales bacterium]MCB9084365.1 hypothetical protein [Pseudobdellovibrionaceae bacterium]